MKFQPNTEQECKCLDESNDRVKFNSSKQKEISVSITDANSNVNEGIEQRNIAQHTVNIDINKDTEEEAVL